jgi:hypothetical protein
VTSQITPFLQQKIPPSAHIKAQAGAVKGNKTLKLFQSKTSLFYGFFLKIRILSQYREVKDLLES